MKNELDQEEIFLSDSIMYNAALMLLNDVDKLLSYLDFTDAYKKYKLLDIFEQLGKKNYFKERIKWPEADQWENATGEFGLEPTNPIMVVDALGQMAYLSHLRWNGKPVVYFSGSVVDPAIFVMHVFSLDGDHLDDMYFDPFHRFYSKKVPRGYTWAEKANGVTGTGCVVQKTIGRTIKKIYTESKEMFGVAAVDPMVAKFNVRAAQKLWREYQRSREDEA